MTWVASFLVEKQASNQRQRDSSYPTPTLHSLLTPSSLTRKFKSKIIMQAFLGEDVFRFGGMFGTFVSLVVQSKTIRAVAREAVS